MRKIIIIPIISLLSGCSFLTAIKTSCKTEISKTAQGNFIVCALCDSTIENKIVNSLNLKK
jgi:hypothetical protein